MADASVRSPQQLASVVLVISLTIEGDYRNRGAFPGLRIDSAEKRSGTNLIFRVPVGFAREVLDDARARRDEIGGGRGLYQAYRALAKNLQFSLDRADGVKDDPGMEAWEKDTRSVGCHPAGMRVHNEDGEALTITGPYKLWRVNGNDGSFRDNDGKRFSYRWGYACTRDGAKESCFYAAGDLYADDGGITHLRLVHSA